MRDGSGAPRPGEPAREVSGSYVRPLRAGSWAWIRRQAPPPPVSLGNRALRTRCRSCHWLPSRGAVDREPPAGDGDPARDVRALAAVRYTIRQGRIIYERDR
jgi:hypothetical protein